MYVRINPSPLFSTGPPLPSDGDCLRERREEEEQEMGMGCIIPSEILLAEDNSQVDPDRSPLKEQVSENLQGCKSGVKFRGSETWSSCSLH